MKAERTSLRRPKKSDENEPTDEDQRLFEKLKRVQSAPTKLPSEEKIEPNNVYPVNEQEQLDKELSTNKGVFTKGTNTTTTTETPSKKEKNQEMNCGKKSDNHDENYTDEEDDPNFIIDVENN